MNLSSSDLRAGIAAEPVAADGVGRPKLRAERELLVVDAAPDVKTESHVMPVAPRNWCPSDAVWSISEGGQYGAGQVGGATLCVIMVARSIAKSAGWES